jgi:acetylxylan esterase
MLLYGDSNKSNHCWEVWNSDTQTHDGGGDSLGIASATRYAINNWGIDTNRVFVTGYSSGAMLTNIMVGAYPDIFRAGSAFAGIPFACFQPTDPFLPNDCVDGKRIKSAQEWGDLVRKAYPGYTGPRPKMQLWHGMSDDLIKPALLDEEIKQWTNVLGISQTPVSTSQNTPISGYTKLVYGSGQVEAYRAAGVGHGIPWREADVLTFFGL